MKLKDDARITGAAMDRTLPRDRRSRALMLVGGLALAAAAVLLWQQFPRGLRVSSDQIRIATVQQGVFRHDLVVRSTAAPLHTVMLDAFELGRVEEILVTDGASVEKGQLLFRLSNRQLRLDLVAREADRAQQISNLSLLRVALETNETEHQRRMLDLEFGLTQARKLHDRHLSLLQQGFIPSWTAEESRDRLEQQQRVRDDERTRAAVELRIKRDGVRQMEQAIERLDAGLSVVSESIQALDVRAPIAGRLTDFRLQLGEIVKPEQRVGRIDDPTEVKLVAEVDEYYLGSVAVGRAGQAKVNGKEHAVEISRVFPQIREGRFAIELVFVGTAPGVMNPGQSAETRLTLGESTAALILPEDAFLNATGGSWVFLISADGRTAERHSIRIGRRNNTQVEVVAGLEAGQRVIVSSYAGYGNAERLQIIG